MTRVPFFLSSFANLRTGRVIICGGLQLVRTLGLESWMRWSKPVHTCFNPGILTKMGRSHSVGINSCNGLIGTKVEAEFRPKLLNRLLEIESKIATGNTRPTSLRNSGCRALWIWES